MHRLLILHFIFLIIALLIAFVLVPLDLLYLDKAPMEEIESYYRNAVTFEKPRVWGIVSSWFLGLSCGRLILKALARA